MSALITALVLTLSMPSFAGSEIRSKADFEKRYNQTNDFIMEPSNSREQKMLVLQDFVKDVIKAFQNLDLPTIGELDEYSDIVLPTGRMSLERFCAGAERNLALEDNMGAGSPYTYEPSDSIKDAKRWVAAICN